MTLRVPVVPVVLTLLYCWPVNSQTKAPSPDPGVTPIRLIDRAEVRVTRIELQPGAVRSVHTLSLIHI